MMGLYPDYKPLGIRKEWEHTSMEETGAGRVMRKYGAPEDWGDPIDSVGWFEDNHENRLRVLVADYANGRRATLRIRKRGGTYQMEFVTPQREMADV